MRAGAIAAIVLLLVAAPSRADDDADLQALVTAHHCGQAYPLTLARIMDRPHDAGLRLLAATCAARLVRDDEARAQLDAGIADHPQDAGLLSLSSEMSMAQGDLDGARSEARRALAIDPGNARASTVEHDLDRLERATARASGDLPGPADPAAAAADHLFELIAAGADGDAMRPFIDPQVLPESARGSDTLHELVTQLRKAATIGGVQYLGWSVEGTVSGPGDHERVSIVLASRNTITQARIDMYAAMYADPTQRPAMSSDERDFLSEVDDADRPALLRRQLGETSIDLDDLVFEMAPHDGRYWVVGVIENGVDMRPQFARSIRDAGGSVPGDASAPGLHWQRWWPYGIALVILAAVMIAIVLAVRPR